MSDADSKLAAFWRDGRPRSPDAAFRLAVLERRSRQRFHRAMAWVILAGLSTLACVAVLAPKLSAVAASLSVGEPWRMLSAIGTCALMLWAFVRSRQTF